MGARWDDRSVAGYLESLAGAPVHVLYVHPLAGPGESTGDKGFGYGTPLEVCYEAAGVERRVVLTTVRPGPFGHEYRADRAFEIVLDHDTYNRLPRHVRALDLGVIRSDGTLASLGAVEDFFLLVEHVEGKPYAIDLDRIRAEGRLADLDLPRADALCDYLVEIHRRRLMDGELYARRVRELVGSSQCIMGLIDSYARHPEAVPARLLHVIERQCVEWRWRIKDKSHRLRQVHGDFHPWNILFRNGADYSVLDRSRGEWGEPADDVTTITVNYLFFSLQRYGRLEGPFERLFSRFWKRYLDETQDEEMLRVAAPFFAFRCLVLASPVWYPRLADSVRMMLLRFSLNVLQEARFDPANMEQYLRAPAL